MDRDLSHFSESDANTVEAIAARVIPGDESDPGAREADVIVYIDRAVGGFEHNLQDLYARGLKLMDDRCEAAYGSPFVGLESEQQDEVLEEIEAQGEGADPGTEQRVLGDFFAVVRQHTIEGMFSDPMYGGNRDYAGWKLMGFPGAQWGYSDQQKQRGFDATTIQPLTLNELRRQRAEKENG